MGAHKRKEKNYCPSYLLHPFVQVCRGLRPTSPCEAEGRRGPEGSAAEDQLLCGQREVSVASAGCSLHKDSVSKPHRPVCGSVVSGIVNKSSFSWLVLFGRADHADEVSTRNTPRPLTNAAFVLLLFQRLPGKWQSLTEKLLPRSCEREAAAVAVAEKRKEDASAIYKSEAVTQRNNEAASESGEHSVNETPQSEAAAAAAAWTELNVPAAGESLFVFRCPPESCDSSGPPKRKKKRNFLNLRKGSVAPTDLP